MIIFPIKPPKRLKSEILLLIIGQWFIYHQKTTTRKFGVTKFQNYIRIYVFFNKSKKIIAIKLKIVIYATYTCPNIVSKFHLAALSRFEENTIFNEKKWHWKGIFGYMAKNSNGWIGMSSYMEIVWNGWHLVQILWF